MHSGHGKNEWVVKLKQLIADASLRKKLGKAGKATVIEKYSARAITPQVAEIFQSLAEH